MDKYNSIIAGLTLSHLSEEQKYSQGLSNKDILKQMDSLKNIQKLIYNGEVPFCENLIKHVVAIFLDNNLTHRNAKLLCYRVLV